MATASAGVDVPMLPTKISLYPSPSRSLAYWRGIIPSKFSLVMGPTSTQFVESVGSPPLNSQL